MRNRKLISIKTIIKEAGNLVDVNVDVNIIDLLFIVIKSKTYNQYNPQKHLQGHCSKYLNSLNVLHRTIPLITN